nr:unnamed protein product [Callosobruchus analis]
MCFGDVRSLIILGYPATIRTLARLEQIVVARAGVVDKEPYIRHKDDTLFKSDLVIHQPDRTVVCDK